MASSPLAVRPSFSLLHPRTTEGGFRRPCDTGMEVLGHSQSPWRSASQSPLDFWCQNVQDFETQTLKLWTRTPNGSEVAPASGINPFFLPASQCPPPTRPVSTSQWLPPFSTLSTELLARPVSSLVTGCDEGSVSPYTCYSQLSHSWSLLTWADGSTGVLLGGSRAQPRPQWDCTDCPAPNPSPTSPDTPTRPLPGRPRYPLSPLAPGSPFGPTSPPSPLLPFSPCRPGVPGRKMANKMGSQRPPRSF